MTDIPEPRRLRFRTGVVALAAVALAAAPLAAQEGARALTLEEALRRAEDASEQVLIARAGVSRARGDILRAQSARLPQVNASASYQRTLASQFEGLGGEAPVIPPRCRAEVDPALPLEERVAILEGLQGCPPTGGLGFDFGATGFGSENSYNLGLSVSLPVYTGGRIPAQQRVARAGRELAAIGLTSAQAQLRLDVTQAYFDAQLADQLVRIAETQFGQAEEALRLTELGERVGQQAEFDVLRARVARDNLVPQLVQARERRALGYDRLRLFLDLPLDGEVELVTLLDQVDAPPDTVDLDDLAAIRAPVREAAAAVAIQDAQVRIARSQWLPNLSLSSQYGVVAFPNSFLPEGDQFRDNWTVTAAVQMPVFTGGRIRGDVLSAEASRLQARTQLQQVRELVLLDTRNALAQLAAARATAEATAGTVQQAERAYQIAELRYREGLSTLLELNDVRLLLAQARTQRASALRDLQVAQTRVELLPFLPVSTPSGIGANANAGIPNGAGNTRAATTQESAQQPAVTTLQGDGAPQGGGVTGVGGNFP